MNRRRLMQLAAGSIAGALLVKPAAAAPKPGLRVSVVEGDPGRALWERLCERDARVRVFVDGVQQMACVTADEALGEAHCFDLDSQLPGCPRGLSWNGQRFVPTEVVKRGHVRIEIT